ncbi:hypothetical protein C0Q70_07960 [Pomacea canaliculata]|uniref:Methenyltetrahydrofolate synthase domain-containing protein n=1 Tax=Pomacea canaliculata TaxID=400727 RepID=A0A2T7PGM3_POMCA|nr:hypothetical protein C0Q70_07960 [Pomacea canaliculata]
MENNNSSAADAEPQQGSEAPPAKSADMCKTAIDSKGVEVSKWSIRKKIWNYMEDNDLVNFPRPPHNRIPNFVDAALAADKVAQLDVFKSARTVKINPDKPQEHARFLTLEARKNLLVPTPRLRTGLFNKIMPPEDANKEMLRKCSTALGVKEHSKRISLTEKVTIDLVIVGSVAVSKEGFRIGKGEGFADLEYAMMATMEAVGPNTVVVTTVMTVKSLKSQKLWLKIMTLLLIILSPQLRLRELQQEAGKDVHLKGQEVDDEEFEERMDRERRERGIRGRGWRGGRRPFRSRRGGGIGRGGGGRRRYRQDDSADGGDESNKENAEDNENGEGGERGGRRRRQYRSNRYRRSKPRQSESEMSDGAGGDHGEEKKGEMQKIEGLHDDATAGELARQDNQRHRRNRGPKEVPSSESANLESMGSSDVPVEGAER